MRYFYKPNCWFEHHKGGAWSHSTPIKRTINPILRKLQFWTDWPLVITSIVNFKSNNPKFKKYTLRRMKLLKDKE